MTDSFVIPERVPDPCTLIIFGPAGHLTRRKLVPARWHLDQQGRLPAAFTLIGVARRELDDVGFRQQLQTALEEFVDRLDGRLLERFMARSFFVRGDASLYASSDWIE